MGRKGVRNPWRSRRCVERRRPVVPRPLGSPSPPELGPRPPRPRPHPTRSGPSRLAASACPTTRAIPAEPARAAPPHPPGDGYQAEARNHRRAGRLHHVPGAGGDATKALAELTAIHGVKTRDQGRI
jgi:hypothetical protein